MRAFPGARTPRLSRPLALATSVVALLMPAHADSTPQPSTPTIEVTPQVLTPYTSGGCNAYVQCYRVRGTADPGAKVTVTITDGVSPGYSVTAVTFTAKRDDRGAGIAAGDWVASPNVTNLGTHDTEPSTLTFTAVAEVGGNVSDPAWAVAEKEAATEGDVTPPQISPNQWPPSNWCHTGIGLGCNPGCIVNTVNAAQGQQVRGACSAPAKIQGYAADETKEAFGIASEIADIVITITRASDDSLVREIRSFSRQYTRAGYDTELSIVDYPPGTYRVTVSAMDAWGHEADEVSSQFTVHPL